MKRTAILLMGPTASGKTDVAVALCKRFPFEVVSVDSALVYRGMDIGTAKPTPEEMGRVPHHLIDCVDPRVDFTLADYVREADAAIGSPGYDHHLPAEGKVWVYLGSPAGFGAADWTALGGQATAHFGAAIVMVGALVWPRLDRSNRRWLVAPAAGVLAAGVMGRAPPKPWYSLKLSIDSPYTVLATALTGSEPAVWGTPRGRRIGRSRRPLPMDFRSSGRTPSSWPPASVKPGPKAKPWKATSWMWLKLAPVWVIMMRFSRTVRFGKMPLPSGIVQTPRRADVQIRIGTLA